MTTRIEAPAGWPALLAEAVSRPGLISEAYSRFWNYSAGNQLLALWQCMLRKIDPGPINTFLHWQELGRTVKKGEKAITLCMPVTIKDRSQHAPGEEEPDPTPATRKVFIYKTRWFVLSQTEGEEYQPQILPTWTEARALESLKILRVSFSHLNGNVQGFATGRSISVSPIAFAPHRTLFHELAHVVLGHTVEADMTDDEQTPRSLQEVEAESVAMICCESLGLGSAEYSRGYIQQWMQSDSIPDKSAQRIFRAADMILRAGRPEKKEAADGSEV
jgi:antirestriction protein ArdC